MRDIKWTIVLKQKFPVGAMGPPPLWARMNATAVENCFNELVQRWLFSDPGHAIQWWSSSSAHRYAAHRTLISATLNDLVDCMINTEQRCTGIPKREKNYTSSSHRVVVRVRANSTRGRCGFWNDRDTTMYVLIIRYCELYIVSQRNKILWFLPSATAITFPLRTSQCVSLPSPRSWKLN
jgi:hypothetical protein